MIYKFLLFVTLIIPISCTERDRTNPFDPENNAGKLEIGLRAVGYNEFIRLRWFETSNLDFDSTMIFRSLNSGESFRQHVILPVGQTKFDDFVSAVDQNYTYYIQLIGENTKSNPTEFVSAIPGPGEIWLLDRWNFEALNLSYDLQNIKRSNYGVWTPQDISISLSSDLALVTYPSFNYFEVFKISGSYDIVMSSTELDHPYDCVYDHVLDRFWITDSSGSLYRINAANQLVVNVFDDLVRPTLISIYKSNILYVLDKGQKYIHQFTNSGNHLGTLKTVGNISLTDPQLFGMDNKNGNVYIVDRRQSGDVLLIYNPQDESASIIYEGSFIKALAVNENMQTIWIIDRIDLNSVIMQLSSAGLRLTELKGYENPIDVQVNPHNGNIIFIDAASSTVWHVRPDKSIIGSYNESRQPYKVLIE